MRFVASPLILVALASCITQQKVESLQRDEAARSSGYPTRRSPAELEQAIQKHTQGYLRTATTFDGRLDQPAPIALEGKQDVCYVAVLRLDAGAAWGVGAEAGVRFAVTRADGPANAGPGVVGPGAVATLGCPAASGPITLAMAPMVGQDPLGRGSFRGELWEMVLTPEQAAQLRAELARRAEEQRAEIARLREERRQRAERACNTCEVRYQGCLGAGRTRRACDDMFDRCRFDEGGVDSVEMCPSPPR